MGGRESFVDIELYLVLGFKFLVAFKFKARNQHTILIKLFKSS